MPPLTHQGLNTFGCYIDFASAGASAEQGGELFVANDGDSYWSAPSVNGSFDEETFLLSVQGNRELSRDEESVEMDDVRFRAIVNDSENLYQMHFETGHFKGYMSYNLGRCRYYHDLNNRGSCEITYIDKNKNIIAGRFEMTLINPECEGDTLMKITDGRFDIHY